MPSESDDRSCLIIVLAVIALFLLGISDRLADIAKKLTPAVTKQESTP